jgi:hypothetical protein
MTRARDLANSTPGTTGQPFATAAGIWSGTSGTYASTWQIAWYVAQVSVTFPAGRFTQAPMVTASGEGQTAGGVWSVPQIAWVWTVSSTGFVSLVGNPYGNYGVNYRWVATQMTSSSAVG